MAKDGNVKMECDHIMLAQSPFYMFLDVQTKQLCNTSVQLITVPKHTVLTVTGFTVGF